MAFPEITGSLLTVVLPFDLDSRLPLALICGYVLLSSAAERAWPLLTAQLLSPVPWDLLHDCDTQEEKFSLDNYSAKTF